MYALGIPISQYRRTTQVLGHESSKPIYYEDEQQDADFYLFKFPNIDEFEFNQDNSVEFDEEYRSPGYARFKRNKALKWKK